jgi:hypothetical protein
LFESNDSNAEAFITAIEEMGPSEKMRNEAGGWRNVRPDPEDFMKAVVRVGKGRLAQRLAQAKLTPPSYVSEALEYLSDS